MDPMGNPVYVQCVFQPSPQQKVPWNFRDPTMNGSCQRGELFKASSWSQEKKHVGKVVTSFFSGEKGCFFSTHLLKGEGIY